MKQDTFINEVIPLLFVGCFGVATQHRENVATSATIQSKERHVVTPVATPKDTTITGKTIMNNRAEKAPQQIHRNTLKTSPLRVPPSQPTGETHIIHQATNQAIPSLTRIVKHVQEKLENYKLITHKCLIRWIANKAFLCYYKHNIQRSVEKN